MKHLTVFICFSAILAVAATERTDEDVYTGQYRVQQQEYANCFGIQAIFTLEQTTFPSAQMRGVTLEGFPFVIELGGLVWVTPFFSTPVGIIRRPGVVLIRNFTSDERTEWCDVYAYPHETVQAWSGIWKVVQLFCYATPATNTLQNCSVYGSAFFVHVDDAFSLRPEPNSSINTARVCSHTKETRALHENENELCNALEHVIGTVWQSDYLHLHFFNDTQTIVGECAYTNCSWIAARVDDPPIGIQPSKEKLVIVILTLLFCVVFMICAGVIIKEKFDRQKRILSMLIEVDDSASFYDIDSVESRESVNAL